MSFDERDPRSHHFEEAGSGFPLLIIPGGGVNATISGLSGPTSPFNPIEACTDDHNGLVDHVAIDWFMATAACAVRLRGSKDSSASGTGLPNK